MLYLPAIKRSKLNPVPFFSLRALLLNISLINQKKKEKHIKS